jgi:hypothetical protein
MIGSLKIMILSAADAGNMQRAAEALQMQREAE